MILVKGGRIIDGTGKPSYKADVLLKGDRITAIGSFREKSWEEVIDGNGFYLSPGFIDSTNRSDHYLSIFEEPLQEDFLTQGVTTIIGGHCGSSLAPLLYGSLESIRKWADTNKINVDWHTMQEFFEAMVHRPLGVNFGTLAGHSTIRRALIGEALRDLTINETTVFKDLLSRAIAEGALGFSTGLSFAHAKQTPYSELKELTLAAAQAGGIYSTHLRDDKKEILYSVRETIRLARETGIKTIISHFRPKIGYENVFAEALELLEIEGRNLDIHFTGYPFDTSLMPIYMVLPEWIRHGNLEDMLISVLKPHVRERAGKEMPKIKEGDIVIAEAPGFEYLQGKTLESFAENRNLGLMDGLFTLMEITKMRAVIFYKNVNLDMAIQSLFHSKAVISSNCPNLSSGAPASHRDRILKTFPRFLEIALKARLLPIEKAIQKITSIPANKFGLQERGEIKEGAFADLTVFNEDGIEHVIINGQFALKNGASQKALAGRIIKRHA